MSQCFGLRFGYSQILVYDSVVSQPGCNWTDAHVAQGFVRREGVVCFGTLLGYGKAEVEAIHGDFAPRDMPRVIRCPLGLESGSVWVVGPEEWPEPEDHKVALSPGTWDPELFLVTLGEACGKTDWQVHAYCLMSNHFHLVAETPRGNLSEGMKWLLGVYTARFNRKHRLFGHLFAGRYKALPVDGSGTGYLKSACDYVHLNPVRAGLLSAEQLRAVFAGAAAAAGMAAHGPLAGRVGHPPGQLGGEKTVWPADRGAAKGRGHRRPEPAAPRVVSGQRRVPRGTAAADEPRWPGPLWRTGVAGVR